ncbi:CrcB family protein [Kocuria sp. JC486]|uniref:fluoride efflux transporter FluC n=1 Tax=Kocuria sp. JC486 TaxID=1970736 RepID=UPI0014232832|nr:CrcB family protein [Kocuria sp. JC486]NHU85547.1 CrcB family protein [Kocuria sp. JC486]
MTPILVSAVAGGVGAAARFVLDGEIRVRWRGGVPLSTLLINVLGSLVLGLAVGLAAPSSGSFTVPADPGPWVLVAVGFCGGFTTFSTAMFETLQPLYERQPWAALAYLWGTAVAAVVAVGLGLAVGLILV